MRRGIVAVLCVSLLAVAVFVGGAASYTPGPPAAAREDGTYVALERTVCFGYCPAYRITIHDDGRVHYQGQHFVKVCGPRDYRVDTADVTKLFAAFKAADFFSLKDAYVARITDTPDLRHRGAVRRPIPARCRLSRDYRWHAASRRRSRSRGRPRCQDRRSRRHTGFNRPLRGPLAILRAAEPGRAGRSHDEALCQAWASPGEGRAIPGGAAS